MMLKSLTILLIMLPFFRANAQDHPKQVSDLAQQNLAQFLAKIPVGQEANFGFTNREDFSKCTLGVPFAVITVKKEFFKGEVLQEMDYIQKNNEWRVPVLLNGQSKVLLTVIKKGEQFEVVDIGGALLANELQQVSATTQNASLYLFRIYPLAMDFLVTVPTGSSLEQGSYLPLTSAKKALSSDTKDKFQQLELLQVLKNYYNQHAKTGP